MLHLRLCLSERAPLLVALLLSVGAAPAAEPEPAPSSQQTRESFCVVGYLPEYRLDAFELSSSALTDLIFFSLEPGPNGDINSQSLTPDALKKLQAVKQRNKLRLLATVGGWGRSKGFAPMATDARTRKQFIENLVRFCLQNEFDGIDFDWEHPENQKEEQAYADLIVETHQAFRPRGLLVTVALAAWQRVEPRALAAADRIHLMAYDHDGPKHSTPQRARADVEQLMKRGARREKICLGLPFYGRDMANRGQTMTYAQILARYKPQPAADEAGGIYFNGPETIRQKTRYARDEGLAGVMIWELGQDAPGDDSLLRAIRQVPPK
ncbi:MAG TPA: glycoside hydrolase family 18 protein [Pirellulales bacterium]|nr:glycoside hydrolase family 18 protein [Pirellulales bacterium]